MQGFDWTVTSKGDVHMISKVKDTENNVTKQVHTYKKAGETTFVTTTDFAGAASIYTINKDIYIIGLTNNGRVFVEKAAGGTNNFTRIYQANTGKSFRHGKVHIAEGKLYYYLMEKKSGNGQPIYLQVINLDIAAQPFNIKLTAPFNNQIFTTEETITLSANAATDTGAITKVEFWVDDTVYKEDLSAPYTVQFTNAMVGVYKLKAIAYNSNNETIATEEISIQINAKDNTDLTGSTYRLKNLETGRYLDSEGASVITSISEVGKDKEWEFIKAGEYYNIDSKSDKGILRAAGNPVGAVINTNFTAPRADSDKQWTVIYESDGTYRFKTRNAERYLYNAPNNTVIHSENTDNGSKWQIESATLSLETDKTVRMAVKIYPNPTDNNFTIKLNGLNSATLVISDVLGKVMYKRLISKHLNRIDNDGRFKTGIYFISVTGEDNKRYNSKLIIH